MRADLVHYVGDVAADNQRIVTVQRHFAAAATAKTLVQVDRTVTTYGYGQHCKTSNNANADASQALGVLLGTVAAGEWGEVQVEGPCTLVTCEAAVAAGDQLYACNVTTGADGQVVAAAAGDIVEVDFPQVGIAMTAASSGTCTVLLTNPQKVSS
jgi:hypothetical protein